MIFEYDDNKSATNKEKHGVDFVEAQAIWQDENALELPGRIVDGEARFIVIGRVGAKLRAAAITYRGEAIRIISVRRARKNEIAAYES